MATDHVLTEASAITCGHSPPPPPPPTPPPTATVAACPIPPTSSSSPCKFVQSLGGTAQRLTVGGAPVLLADAFTGSPFAPPPPPPPAKPKATAGQTLLRAE
jgi:hypothetical protein